jgi:oxygen-dependent protoporphyrinogen oxidase
MQMSGRESSRERHVVVVGGGISGLAAAERLARAREALRITLVESSARLGGCIGTERVDGFVIERGPDVFLASKPAALELCERVGIAARVIATRPEARGSYVVRGGRLHRLPEGMSGLVPTRLAPFARSALVSPWGKLRVALEWMVPRRDATDEESVERFVTRRVGREMYERVVEPLLSGIYAGDGARLSLDATFPRLRAMEREHGGLLRGIRAARANGAGAMPSIAGLGKGRTGFLSLVGGLGELVDGVAHALGEAGVEVRTGARVERIEPRRAGRLARVTLEGGEVLEADAVIVATPAPVTAALLADADAALARELASIEHASTAIVTLGYGPGAAPRADDATGYTVPRVERRPVLACTWSASKFEGRAPAGHSLFRVFVGGVGREAELARDDASLVALARAELGEMLGVAGEPVLARVVRWERTMPQYDLGHRARLQRIDARVAALDGIALAGSAQLGVGIPDCVRSGERAAEGSLVTMARQNPD